MNLRQRLRADGTQMKSSVLITVMALAFVASSTAWSQDATWTVAFRRNFANSPERWTGEKSCQSDFENGLIARHFAQFESSERQVECSIDGINNAVCVNVAEDTPRVGVFDPEQQRISVWSVRTFRYRPIPVLHYFTIHLDETRSPVSTTTEVRYYYKNFREGWDSDIIKADDRPDKRAPLCAAHFATSMSTARDPLGNLPDSMTGRTVLERF